MYEIVACARHTETLEEMIVYKSLSASEDFPEGSVWIRPRSMFESYIDHDGVQKKRFHIVE